MKRIIKYTSLLMLVLLMVFSLSACGKEEKEADYNEDQVNQVTFNVLALMQRSVNPGMAESIANASEEDLEAFESEIASMGLMIDGKAFQSGYGSYTDAVNGDLGEIVSEADSAEISTDGDTIISDITVTGTKTFPDGSPRTANVEIMMSKRGKVSSVVYNVNRTFGEKIVNAGLNTVLGMGTTFCLLIFISIVIWLMGTIVQNMEKKKASAEEKASVTDNVVSQIERKEEQAISEADDGALIAVISAAIAAYESERGGAAVSPDSFVVRSLRRRG